MVVTTIHRKAKSPVNFSSREKTAPWPHICNLLLLLISGCGGLKGTTPFVRALPGASWCPEKAAASGSCGWAEGASGFGSFLGWPWCWTQAAVLLSTLSLAKLCMYRATAQCLWHFSHVLWGSQGSCCLSCRAPCAPEQLWSRGALLHCSLKCEVLLGSPRVMCWGFFLSLYDLKYSRRMEHLSCQGRESWICSVWRREGWGDLKKPSSTWGGLQEGKRGTSYKVIKW